MEIDQGFLGEYLIVTYVPYVAVFEVSLCLMVLHFLSFPKHYLQLGQRSTVLNPDLKALQIQWCLNPALFSKRIWNNNQLLGELTP